MFGTPRTIALSFGLTLNANVTINGPGANLLTIKEGGENKMIAIFTVNRTISANLSGFSLSNANTAIINNGTTTTTNCTLSGNFIALKNFGTATATNCTLSGNGTGFKNYGLVTTTNCTLSANGTGLENNGAATCTNCTLSANNNGIYNDSGTVTVTNCTLSANVNAGLFNRSAATLQNSLVVGNPTNVDGTFSDGGSNITTGTAADAGLDPNGLQQNGGTVRTIALVARSPAINAGNNALIPSGVTTDGRGTGFARVQNGTVDVGSFEFNSFVPSLSVNTISDEDNGTSDARFGSGTSLREALNTANASPNSTITFDPNVFGTKQTILVTQGQSLPDITSNLTLSGPPVGVVVKAAKVGAPVLTVPQGVSLTLSHILMSGGMSSISNAGTLVVSDSSLSGTLTNLVNTGTATLTNTTLSNSRTGVDNSGTLNMNQCLFTNNTTGISTASGATTTVNQSTFFRSTTALLCSGTMTLSNSTLYGNTNAVKVQGGTSTVAQCTLVGNSGSAVTGSSGATLTVNRCTVAGNGAGLLTNGAQTDLRNSLLVSNSTNLSGQATRSYNLINSTATRVGLETDGSDHVLLKNNGGSTLTVALLPGAPVIDRATPAIKMGFDQRGSSFARVVNGRADIGSFEFGNPAPAKAPTRRSSAPSS